MINFDFEFYRPDRIEEAVKLYKTLKEEGKKTLYYGGGTEIVTSFRKETVKADALIDLKGISRCHEQGVEGDYIFFGSTLTLNDIVEANYFPLLSDICRKIADHTVRNALTLGGNICGRLPYRESAMAFMLSDAYCIIATEIGTKEIEFNTAFDKRLNLSDGEFLIGIKVHKKSITDRYYNNRKVKSGTIDYPVIHLAMVENRGIIRAAFSGVTGFAFRSEKVDKLLSKSSDHETISEEIMSGLEFPIRDDLRSSKEYRSMLLQKALKNGLDFLGGEEHEGL